MAKKKINPAQIEIPFADVQEIVKGYLECAIWTEEEKLKEEVANLGQDPGDIIIQDFSKGAQKRALQDVSRFIALCGPHIILEALETVNPSVIGHDLWLSRNGHGSGFFDRDQYLCAHYLQDKARSLGAVDIYINRKKLNFF